MRTDPTENGGLFIGRRPGTAPVRYARLPESGSSARQAVDRTLAAAMLAAAGWSGTPESGGALHDPCCGSGTIAIEAAQIAMDLAPGRLRRFAFERLLPFANPERRAEWQRLLAEKGIPCGPVQTMDELFRHPQTDARHMTVTMHHPTVGPLKLVASPLKLSGTPVSYRLPPPLAGEHNNEAETRWQNDPEAEGNDNESP